MVTRSTLALLLSFQLTGKRMGEEDGDERVKEGKGPGGVERPGVDISS